MSRCILHVDMDAFYASVEQRDDPRLQGKPVIVGGNLKRGVVLAASYEVRPFGVRSAIPMAQAVKLAPQAIVVPPRFSPYAQASEEVFRIFESFTPQVEGLSLDEAFLDVTASVQLFGSPWDMATRIRARIAQELSLPASAGIAPSKFVAKIVSDAAKPNGQKEVKPDDVVSYLAPLPVTRLWGVGPKSEASLKGLGLHTVGDIARADPIWLSRNLGDSGLHWSQLAHGIDERPVVPDRSAKSIGAEDTFEEDLPLTQEALGVHIHSQALRVGRRLRRAGLSARVVVLKLKLADFKLVTRRMTLPSSTDDGQTLYRAALELLDRAEGGQVRLTGISVQDFGGQASQLGLFAHPSVSPTRERLNSALDRIAERFGEGAVTTADLVKENELSDSDEEARRNMGASRIDRTRGGSKPQ